MCGIFGVLTTKESPLTRSGLQSTVDRLFRLSESRGKEAAGICLLTDETIRVYKEGVPASTMIRRQAYRRLFSDALGSRKSEQRKRLGQAVAVVGHTRMVTNGAEALAENNQPVVADGMVAVHNGIIVNDADLWDRFPTLRRRGEVDTEVLLRLIRKFERDEGSVVAATQAAFRHIEGSASIAALFADRDYLLLASNTGSLYSCVNAAGNTCVFASEQSILRRLISVRRARAELGQPDITRMAAGTGCLVRIGDLTRQAFRLNPDGERAEDVGGNGRTARAIVDSSNGAGPRSAPSPSVGPTGPPPVERDPEADNLDEALGSLRRCTRCILPETMPFITFDAQGVCNYCHRHRGQMVLGKAALEAAVAPYRRGNGEPDCLVGLSGGRDSCYSLHYVKTVLKMNPVTYTYDWGMVTDLARRNISRMCGALGIEHILVSANIPRKRRNIQKNVNAWLRRPELGIVPLFMAGDKPWLYHARKVSRQIGVDLVFMGTNVSLENTDFKTGFCGVGPIDCHAQRMTVRSALRRLHLAAYYAKEFCLNPAYLNASIGDTLAAFAAYYLMSHASLNLFRYIPWDESEIDTTLRDRYGWEGATDTATTWRVGDGTAAFYNYIYTTVAGFSEHDTFRSNQIREGLISREAALASVREESRPRYESIRWYCRTVGLDFEHTLETIRRIPKLYSTTKRSSGHFPRTIESSAN